MSRPRPATWRECCEGPAPSRSPSRSPSQRAPLGQSGVPPVAGLFFAGARPFPLPPRPPPPISVHMLVCVSVRGWVCISIVGRRSVAVFGCPRSACALGAVAPMSHAARCPPLPAPALLLPALSVGAPPACPSWARCARSALNGHAGGAPSLAAWQLLAAGSRSRLIASFFATSV